MLTYPETYPHQYPHQYPYTPIESPYLRASISFPIFLATSTTAGWGVPHFTSRILLQSWDGFKWEDRNVFSGLGQVRSRPPWWPSTNIAGENGLFFWWGYLLNMVIFRSYVCLPEASCIRIVSTFSWLKHVWFPCWGSRDPQSWLFSVSIHPFLVVPAIHTYKVGSSPHSKDVLNGYLGTFQDVFEHWATQPFPVFLEEKLATNPLKPAIAGVKKSPCFNQLESSHFEQRCAQQQGTSL